MKIRVFTDGACSENPGPGGWAVAFNTEKKCYTVSGNELHTTNNRMELKAVIEAFRKILKKATKFDEFEIFSDSAYVVNAINNNWIEVWERNNWKTTKCEDVKNRDLWEEFCKIRKQISQIGVSIKVIKIKGHSGNAFNEFVDKIAKEESIKAKEKR